MHEETTYLKRINDYEYVQEDINNKERPPYRWVKRQEKVSLRLKNLRFSSDVLIGGYHSLDILTDADNPEIPTLTNRNQISAQATLPADSDAFYFLAPPEDETDQIFELVPIRDQVSVYLLSNRDASRLKLGLVRGEAPFSLTSYHYKRPWLASLSFLLPIPQSLYEMAEARIDRLPTTTIHVEMNCNALVQSLPFGDFDSRPMVFLPEDYAYLWHASLEWEVPKPD